MNLFFRKAGSGPTFIIIHGLYGSSDNWMTIGKILSKKYTVYMIDTRNHGHSPFSDINSYDSMKNDLANFFVHHKIKKATLLGHSMGGKTAMWFAANYPDKIEKLIIVDIAPKNYLKLKDKSQYKNHKNMLLTMRDINLSKMDKRSDVDNYLKPIIEEKRLRNFLLKNITRDNISKQYRWRININILIKYLDEIVGGVNEEWFNDRIPITRYPIIFIRGLQSQYISDNDIPLIKNIYPEAFIYDIPEAGHWLHSEKPKDFIQTVLKH